MKLVRLIIFGVIALAQLAVPGSVVWHRYQTLRQGRVWKFKTAPVDPVDAVRGRYIALRLLADEAPTDQALSSSLAYAVLKEDENGFARIDHLSPTHLNGDNVVRVETAGWWSQTQHVRFPFDRFWVSERNGSAAEQAYFANSRRGNDNAYVTVRVHNGDAAIEQLYLDNKPLPEYLRQQPQKR
jgi:uncharacterized membrane-anchored protein